MGYETYAGILAEDIHSATIATIAKDGHPQTRIIDMMLWDENGIYFLTARGKAFYEQLMEQKYVSISAAKDKKSVSLRGSITNIGQDKLEEIFRKNTYMQKIYPSGTRDVLEVFCIDDAQGEYFDISNPSHIVRDSFTIGNAQAEKFGYYVGEGCTNCKSCMTVCPQRCIIEENHVAVIVQKQCLHCGACVQACPQNVICKWR